MGPRNQEEKSSSEGLEDWELTGAIYFAPTVERILYGAHTVENASVREVERLSPVRGAGPRARGIDVLGYESPSAFRARETGGVAFDR
jgi:hypothetical protein